MKPQFLKENEIIAADMILKEAISGRGVLFATILGKNLAHGLTIENFAIAGKFLESNALIDTNTISKEGKVFKITDKGIEFVNSEKSIQWLITKSLEEETKETAAKSRAFEIEELKLKELRYKVEIEYPDLLKDRKRKFILTVVGLIISLLGNLIQFISYRI